MKNLSRLLFKPKWQDKDALVRLPAVAGDNDPELVAALPELTRSDPDARIRLAALKRLGDYERWRERSTGDADPEIRRVARATYISLLCAGGRNTPALPRLVAELDTLSPAELETVATTAANRDLRAAALTHVTRPALLAERAVMDPDPNLRLTILARVTDADALERIAARLRKTDKAASRIARERLQALRIDAGDAAAISARARVLCERIETLIRSPHDDMPSAIAALQQQWKGLGTSVPPDLVLRFEASVALAGRLSQRSAATSETIESADASGHDITAAAEPELTVDSTLAATAASTLTADEPGPSAAIAEATPMKGDQSAAAEPIVAGGESAHRAPIATSADSAASERERRDAARLRVEESISLYAQKLDAGDTAGAQALHGQLVEMMKGGGSGAIAIGHRLAPLHARFAELRRWQTWSNRRRRRALCDEVENLAGSGLHPDAIANRIHDARVEWEHLEAIEGGAPTAETTGLSRRFHAICQQVLKPAHAYFEKRHAVRDSHRGEIEKLLAGGDALVRDGTDWKVLTARRRQLAAALRTLDTVSPRDRSHLAKRIKDAIEAVSPIIEAHHREIEVGKARLIERANDLAQRPDRAAPRTARELQQQWTALGEGRRASDQRQWREFRAACDRVFGALDAERMREETRAAGENAKAREIVDAAVALAADASVHADEANARRRELENRWKAVATTDRGLERKFHDAIRALTARAAELVRASRLARYKDAFDRYAMIRSLERSGQGADGSSDPALDGVTAEFAAPLRARFLRLSGDQEPTSASLEAGRDVLVRLEFLAGIASPAEDRERRMNHQVARLSARMRGGGDSQGVEAELTSLMIAWFSLAGPLPDELERRFADAGSAVIATLP